MVEGGLTVPTVMVAVLLSTLPTLLLTRTQ